MTRRIHFDLDVLRSFALGVELGSFAKAADRLGRSTSAVSAQLKKLEEQAGSPLLRRQGRGMALTDAGETMLGYARRLLELNDEATAAIHGAELEGWIRLGLQEDFGESLLPDVLGRFARAHPKVRIEARIARNVELLDRVTTGRLDLALAWDAGVATPHVERIGETPMCWIGAADGELGWSRDSGEPLPLVSLDAPCLMRTAATASLDRAGVPWRIAFTSASLAGIWAAVAAGLGVALRTRVGLPGVVRVLDGGEVGLPVMPVLGLSLHRAEAEPAPAVARLESILRQRLEVIPLRD
ncbi:LysR substrate-binding domain-containing protein [Dyella koreensis]